jgi:hypothetical protein
MNSRRRILNPLVLIGGAYRGPGCTGTGHHRSSRCRTIAGLYAARLHGANDILQVADVPGEAINTARFEFRKMRCRARAGESGVEGFGESARP